MIVYFVRHGSTRFNEMGLTQGVCDSPLTDQGKSQVAYTKELLKDVHFDIAYSSPSGRAMETANIITTLPLHLDCRLKEIDFGVFEGTPTTIRDALKIDQYCAWDYRPYQGTSIEDVIEGHRVFINEILKKHPNATVLVTGHGCSLTAFCRKYLNVEIDFFQNAQAIQVEITHSLEKVG